MRNCLKCKYADWQKTNKQLAELKREIEFKNAALQQAQKTIETLTEVK